MDDKILKATDEIMRTVRIDSDWLSRDRAAIVKILKQLVEGVQTQTTNTTKVETVKRCNECRFWKDCRIVHLCCGNFFQRA